MAFSQKELDIIKYGQANGRSRAEVESALASFRSGVVPAPKPQVEQTLTGQTLASKLGGRAKDFGKEALNVGTFGLSSLSSQDAQEARQSPEQAGLVGLQALSNAGMAPFRAAGAAGGAVGDIFGAGLQATGLDKPLSEALAPVAQSGVAQKAVQAFQALPKEYQDYLKTGLDASNLIGLGIGKKAVTTGLESVGKLTPSRVNMADDVLQSGKNLKDSIQLSIAKKNVNPQLESSAERLMKETTQNVEDPIVAYEKYLSQSKESMGDIKVDAPISTVGGKIGDAFMNVVKQRQSVGATLGEELKSVGKLRVSVAEPKSKLLAELSDSGLSYNPKTKQLTSFQGSKFAPEEVSMLNQFVKDVEALGETPTVSQIDNFIAKTRSDLSFAKGKSGVVGTTNAERIIKGNLAGLRESLNPANNGISRLSPYWKANQTYSELSDFLEEGATFLGKKTQSGDFAKDASVAKSSVQSILNGGKKDWLIKLEGLTGYPALDDSVLALQAMKDAGDFKGLSLLQAMQETGGLPTSKAGFIQKVLDMAVERGEKLIVGTPEEQTRALLQSLKKPQTAKPTTPKTTPKASSGDKANKINQSNSGIQPNTTPTPPKGKGIRGMMDIDQIIKAFTPSDKSEFTTLVDTLSKAKRMGITGYDKLGGATEKNFVGEYPAKVRSAAIDLIHLVEDYPNKTEIFNSIDDNVMNVIRDSGYDVSYLKTGMSSKIQPDTKGFILVEGKPQEVLAKKVDLGGGVDFFAHESKNGTITITEKNSGMSIGSGQSLQEAIDNSKYVIKEKAGGISKLKELLKTKENKEIINSYSNNPSELVPKKKVVSEDTTGVPVFRGQSHEGLTAFDGANKQRFLSGMDGTSFSLSKESAKNYGDKIVEGIVTNNTILRRKDLSEELKNFIESKVEKLSYDDYVDGTGFENVVSELARIAKGRKKNAIDLTEFFPKSKIDDEIRVLNKDGVKVKSAPKVTPLEQEAKKYKSAEEFVKAQGELVYHGTDANFTEFSLKDFGKTDEGFLGKGVYLTSDKTNAEQYGANIVESFTNLKNPYTYDAPYMFGGFNPAKIARDLGLPENASPRQITDKLKSMGHDGVVVNEITDTGVIPKAEVVVFDPKNIKTKQQLTDIWNKANGTLEQEAKGKTLEEFVKAKSGNQGIYDKTYDEMIQKNRAGAKPFDYELMELLDAIPETKDGNVKIYRATTNGEILPGDNVSIYDMKQYVDPNNRGLNITAAKMGVTKLSGNKDIKFVEKWIPKEDLYQTDAGTQLYAPNGMKSLTDIWKKANKK